MNLDLIFLQFIDMVVEETRFWSTSSSFVMKIEHSPILI